MGKSVLAALLAAIIALLPAASPPLEGASPEGTGKIRCLAVGMDRFVTEKDTAPCSAGNAEIMAALLEDCLPEGTRVTRRVNGPGSVPEMEALIRETFREAGEEDLSCLYLSTHGVIWEEEGETRMAWILSDGTQEDALEPGALREMMDRVPGKKVLILDCCHAGAAAESFRGPEWRVLAGCGAEEDCYFWAAGEANGMGYFTSALENALRASGQEQIDPDSSGSISLKELADRVRTLYGISEPVFLPEGDESPLFLLPEAEENAERILDLRLDPAETTKDGQISVSFHFRTEIPVRIEYRLVPMGPDGWEFEQAARLPDRERSGQRRGVLSPGEKDRTIRVSPEKLGKEGRALLQVVSFRGLYGQVPVPEAAWMIDSEQEKKDDE